jgi:hypothetical protein
MLPISYILSLVDIFKFDKYKSKSNSLIYLDQKHPLINQKIEKIELNFEFCETIDEV